MYYIFFLKRIMMYIYVFKIKIVCARACMPVFVWWVRVCMRACIALTTQDLWVRPLVRHVICLLSLKNLFYFCERLKESFIYIYIYTPQYHFLC